MADGTPLHVDDVDGRSWEIEDLAAHRKRLGEASSADRLGVAVIEIPPGKHPTPAHSHIDEDELFIVLEGSGLSYQTSGSKDVRTYEIGIDDILLHESSGDSHTLIAGEEGLKVLVLAEGSRTHLTWLPRAKQFWIGPRWTPTDLPPPFIAEAKLGPLDVPAPESERPSMIRNLSELPLEEGSEGKLAWATRDIRTKRLVLAHDAMPPDCHNTDLHFHSVREECWFVRGGGGIARIGEEGHELRAGSFWLRRPDGGVGHRIEVGPDGMDLITMGDLLPGDLCVYPEKGSMKPARGIEIPIVPFPGE